MFRHTPYPRPVTFTTPARVTGPARNQRNRAGRQSALAYVKDTFEAAAPSSPAPSGIAPLRARHAAKCLDDSIARAEEEYTRVRRLRDQQAACVAAQERALAQLEGESATLDIELARVEAALHDVDREVAEVRAAMAARAAPKKSTPSTRLSCTLRSFAKAASRS